MNEMRILQKLEMLPRTGVPKCTSTTTCSVSGLHEFHVATQMRQVCTLHAGLGEGMHMYVHTVFVPAKSSHAEFLEIWR